MTSMVERMARAYMRQWKAEWEAIGQSAPDWDDFPTASQQATIRTMIAALSEMREPTEVMEKAAEDACPEYDEDLECFTVSLFRSEYTAAIDAEIAAYEGKK